LSVEVAYRRSVSIHIDLSAIQDNPESINGNAAPDELPGAQSLSGNHIADGFAVVSVDEALELRQSGIKQPILVLQGPQSVDACAEMKHHELWPVIHDLHQYSWYRRCAEKEDLHAWLKVDTGMGRLGMTPEGIMLYGCNPLSGKLPENVTLRPAMSVSAPIISVKQLSAGAGIGYAQSYRCPEDMSIGYVALGYRDGLPRVLDTSATVTVNGTSCPIVGRVSMDSVAIDLRRCPSAVPGTSAEFWGDEASIDSLARAAGTINYELLTSIRGQIRYIS